MTAYVVFVGAATSCAADPETDGQPVVAVSQPLSGRLTSGSANANDDDCTPFQYQRLAWAQRYSSAVLMNPGFEECVRSRAADYHVQCSVDPDYTAPLEDKLDDAFDALHAGNHIQVLCSTEPGDFAHASPHVEDTKEMIFGNHWTRAWWDNETGNGNWSAAHHPYSFDAVGMTHEFSHTHGYHHPEHDCYAEASPCSGALGEQSKCGWLELCGGSGTPPGAPGEWAWNIPGSKNRCAVEAGIDEGDYHASGLDPSLPYIISTCAGGLIADSASACGGSIGGGGCPAGEFPLLSDYAYNSKTSSGAYVGACTCYGGSHHRVALSALDGSWVQATDGGGAGQVLQATGDAWGPWESLFFVDANGGSLEHGDVIFIRTYRSEADVGYFASAAPGSGQVARASSTTRTDPYTYWQVKRAAGAGRVVDGDTVYLLNLARGRHLTAIGGGGGELHTDAPWTNAWERFTIHMPVRRQLAAVRTNDGRYVTYDPEGESDLRTDELENELDAAGHARRASRTQSFWLIDWNGGDVEHGDQVSFESSLEMRHWSVFNGVGANVTGSSIKANGEWRVFNLLRDAGAGPLASGDTVYFTSTSNGNYLTAWPAGYAHAFRIRNNATAGYSWERFRLFFEQARGTCSSSGDDCFVTADCATGTCEDAAVRFDVR